MDIQSKGYNTLAAFRAIFDKLSASAVLTIANGQATRVWNGNLLHILRKEPEPYAHGDEEDPYHEKRG